MSLFIKQLSILFLSFLAIFSVADDENIGSSDTLLVAKVESINLQTGLLFIDDQPYYLTNSTQVRRYGDAEESQLPWSSLEMGDWVMLEFEYASSVRRYVVKSATLVPFELVPTLKSGASEE